MSAEARKTDLRHIAMGMYSEVVEYVEVYANKEWTTERKLSRGLNLWLKFDGTFMTLAMSRERAKPSQYEINIVCNVFEVPKESRTVTETVKEGTNWHRAWIRWTKPPTQHPLVSVQDADDEIPF